MGVLDGLAKVGHPFLDQTLSFTSVFLFLFLRPMRCPHRKKARPHPAHRGEGARTLTDRWNYAIVT